MCGTPGSRWICPRCTLANPPNATFCAVCGAAPAATKEQKPSAPASSAQQAEVARHRAMMVSGIQFQMGMPRLMDGSDEDSEASDAEAAPPKGRPQTQAEKDAADDAADEAAAIAASMAGAGKDPKKKPKTARDGSDEDSEETSTDSSDDDPPPPKPATSAAPPPPSGAKGGPPPPPKPGAEGKEPPKAPEGKTVEAPASGQLPAEGKKEKKPKKPKKPKELDADGNPIKTSKKTKLMKAKKRRQAKARAKAAEERLAAEEAALAQLLQDAAPEGKKAGAPPPPGASAASAPPPAAPAAASPPPPAATAATAAAPPPPADAKAAPPAPVRNIPIMPLTFVFFGNSGCGKSFLINELKENQKQYFKGLSASAAARSRTNFIECEGLLDTEGRTGAFLEQITQACQTARTIPVLVLDYKFRFTDSFDACLAALSLSLNLVANDYILVINQIQSSKKVGAAAVATQLKEQFVHISRHIGRAPSKTCLVNFDGDFTQDLIAGRYLPLQGVLNFESLSTVIVDESRKLQFVAAQLQITENIQTTRSDNMDKFWPSTKEDEKWSGIPEQIRGAWTDKDPAVQLFDKAPFVVPVPPSIEKAAADIGDLSKQLDAAELPNFKGKQKEMKLTLARLALVQQVLVGELATRPGSP